MAPVNRDLFEPNSQHGTYYSDMYEEVFAIQFSKIIHCHNIGCPLSHWLCDTIWANNIRSASTKRRQRSGEADFQKPKKYLEDLVSLYIFPCKSNGVTVMPVHFE